MSSITKPKVLWNDTTQEYSRRLKVYLEKSGQVEKIIDVLRCYIPSTIDHIFHDLQSPKNINILSVGSGNGEMDLQILKIINDEMQRNSKNDDLPINMFNRAIEPNKVSLGLYKTAIDNLPKELSSKIVFDIDHPKTFQEYVMEAQQPSGQFDIVHFIHSLYFLDVEKALTYCYEKELREKGLIICVSVVCGRDDVMECIHQKKIEEGKPDLLNYDKRKDILMVVEKYAWKYQEFIQEYYIDVTEIFDEKSIDGNLFLDFLVYAINFRFETTKNTVNEYLDVVKKNAIIKDRKYFAKKVQSVVFIYK